MKTSSKMASNAILISILLVWSGPSCTLAEKLSVLLPGQNTEFSIEDDSHEIFDIRSNGGVGLSLPLPPSGSGSLPLTSASPQLVLDAPPATVPTSPPGARSGGIFGNIGGGVNLQGSIPTINALYDVPDAGSNLNTVGACQAETVIVTSRAVVTSTQLSISQIVVPTTVYQERVVTSTDIRVQTNFQTSYVTIQAPAQTIVRSQTVTSRVVQTETVVRTTTRLQQQYFTSTQTQFSTQVVTRPVTEEVTRTAVRTQYISVPVTTVSTVVTTEVQTSRISVPTYITVTSTETQTQTQACATSSSSSGSGYSYGSGTSYGGSTSNYGSNSGGYYLVGHQGGTSGGYRPGYSGGYYGQSYRQPGRYSGKKKGLFSKWFK